MNLLVAFAYREIVRHIPSLIPFSTINNLPILLNRSNFTFVFSKAGCHTNPESERKRAESSYMF